MWRSSFGRHELPDFFFLPFFNSLIPIGENAESIFSHLFLIVSSHPLGSSSFFMGTWFPSQGVDPTVPGATLPPSGRGWLGFPECR